MSERARVLFFATLRDLAGVKETSLEFAPGIKIAGIKALVLERFPALAGHVDVMIVAMNHEFAGDDQLVPDGAEIAMFPPVSGGSSAPGAFADFVAITTEPIDINAILERIASATTGGVCLFTGTVRGLTSRGTPHETKFLEYEAYQAMAEEKMRQICAEIHARWSEVHGIALVQRTGKLPRGDISVVVACAAGHRDAGIFEAAHYGIDRLKQIVPVWKKEVTTDGEEWVEGEYLPRQGE